MASWIKNIVQFVAVPAGATVSLPHKLNIPSNKSVTPDILLLEANGNFFGGVTANDLVVSVTNNDVIAHDLNVLCEYWHSLERAFGGAPNVDLTPRPFVVGGESVGGGVFATVAYVNAQTTRATNYEWRGREIDRRE